MHKEVFICHVREDKQQVVEPLVNALEKANISYWYDEAEIKWGDSITREVNEGLRTSHFVLVILSSAFVEKPWVQRELNSVLNIEASTGKVKILPLVVETDSQKQQDILKTFPLLNDKSYLTWDVNNLKSIINSLLELLRGDFRPKEESHKSSTNNKIGGNDTEPKCPYQGLKPFTKDRAKFFFGRKNEVKLLKEKLNNFNFILIVGSSGVGKSSLVRAGLIPSLEKEGWYVPEPIMPGSDPISRLRNTLEDFFGTNGILEEFQGWYQQFINSQSDINNLESIITNLPGEQKILLVLDQFEEILRFAEEANLADFFISQINKLVGNNNRLFIVATMRTDFNFLINGYTSIASSLQEGKIFSFPLSPLEGENSKEAIIKPAINQGCQFGEGLLELILRDFEEEKNSLPLLQFTLTELWNYGCRNSNDNQLLVKHYKSIGGLKKSLNILADKIFNEFKEELQKDMAEHLFLNLVRTSEYDSDNIKDTRKRQKKKELLKIGGTNKDNRKAIQYVLDKFIRNGLLVSDGEWIDLAHETLMEAWEKFKEWRAKDRNIRRIVEQMRDALTKWNENQKSDSFLLSEALLIQVDDIIRTQEQQYRLDQEFQDKGLKIFYDQSIENYKKSQLIKAQNLELQAKKAQENLYSREPSEPLSGLMKTLQLVNQSLKSRLSDLPGSVQNALRLSMEIAREQNCFQEHKDIVLCVAISPNGKWIVSGGLDKTLSLWDIAGKFHKVYPGHEAGIRSVAFSHDNNWIISGSADNTLRRWKIDKTIMDGQSFIQVQQIGEPFTGHKDWVRSVAISSCGDYIVSGSRDRKLLLWDSEGKLIHKFPEIHKDWILSVAIWTNRENSDNNFIVSSSADRTIQLWGLDGQTISEPFKGHEGWVRSIAISQDGKYIVSGSEDKTIRLWDLNGNCLKIFEGHENRVLSVAIWQYFKSSNNQDCGFIIASGSADHTIRLWNFEVYLNSKKQLSFDGDSIGLPLRGHKDWVRDIKISADGKFIASASRDKTVRIWSLEGIPTGKLFGKHEKGRILSVAFSSDGKYIVSGGEDKYIYLWNSNGSLKKKFGEHGNWVRSVRFTAKNEYIVSGSADNKLRLCNYKTEELVEPQQDDEHESWIRSVTVSPDGKYIVSSSNDKTLCLWQFIPQESHQSNQLKLQKCFICKHNKEVISVAFSPDSKLIVSGSADKTIKLWDLNGKLETGEKVFEGHKDRVLSVGFSPDGNYIISASYDQTICLWNLKGELIWQQKCKERVRYVAFSPVKEFPLFASGNQDGTIQLWSLGSLGVYKVGNPLKGHQDVVRSIKFSPDGKHIVSASEDGTLRLWEAGNWKDWLKVCCERIKDHPALNNSKDEIAKEVREIVEKTLKGRKF